MINALKRHLHGQVKGENVGDYTKSSKFNLDKLTKDFHGSNDRGIKQFQYLSIVTAQDIPTVT